MPVNSKIIKQLWSTGLVLIMSISAIQAQLLRDTANMNLVKKDIDYIYNLQFNDARLLYTRITAAYPEHPVVFLLRGMMTYWENYPLLNTSSARKSFEEDLRQCIRISEKNNNPDNEAEYLLANLCARGFLLLYYSANNFVMEVIPLATSTYKYLMRSFDFTSACTDLFYFTGVYNYYRDAYPKVFPVYKPLVMIFPRGNMETGIYQLNLSAASSVVLRAESTFLLTYIYINFENNFQGALKYSGSLRELYPDNLQFQTDYLKNLLLLTRYDEADKLIESLHVKTDNKFFQAQLSILKGILQEKKYLDKAGARQYYNEGISGLSLFGDYGNEYTAYGYFGLSRISEANGEKQAGKMYRKEALRVAAFKKIDFD